MQKEEFQFNKEVAGTKEGGEPSVAPISSITTEGHSRAMEGREKLSKFIKEISEKLKAEGVPVNEDCRIDMSEFTLVHNYTEIAKDKEMLGEFEKMHNPGLTREEVKEKKKHRDGEKFEMLKTALFSKFLGEKFIIARSSEYDDIKRGVDNLILEKATGNLVCAFDEVVDLSEKDKKKKENEMKDRYEEKKKKIKDQNIEWGGGKIKYGIGMKDGKVILKEYENTPIFYLKVLKEELYKNLDKLIPSFDEKSPEEIELFDNLINSLSEQYAELKIDEDKLRPNIKESLAKFGKVLKGIKKERKREKFLASQ